MELLLLTDISGVGRKNDLIVVGDGFALNNLLPSRKALVVTPSVRKRYAEQIKKRAEERELEKAARSSVQAALNGKAVTIKRKATKTGKLYASVTQEAIAEALKEKHGFDVAVADIIVDEHIKAIGDHIVHIGRDGNVSVTVKIEKEA